MAIINQHLIHSRDRQMLRWLEHEHRPDGRRYIGHLLVRLLGMTPTDRAAFRKAGGFKLRLSRQLRILEQLEFPSASRRERMPLVGALIAAINGAGAKDKRCPMPLRRWLGYKQQSQAETWGAQVAAQYWPGRSQKRRRLRDIFAGAAAHLVLSKDLADELKNRDAPRFLARALVNHLLGKAKESDFEKAPKATRAFVLKLCGAEQLQQAITCLRELSTITTKRNERKDGPAKRLKEALAEQFRLIRASRYFCVEHFSQEAVLSLAPWQLDRLKANRGGAKKAAGQLHTHLDAIPGLSPKLVSLQRYLRASAFPRRSR